MRFFHTRPRARFFHSAHNCFASGVVKASHCGFNLGFLTDCDTKYFFIHLFAFPIVYFMDCLSFLPTVLKLDYLSYY